ncbi:MAG: phosphoribosylformylglycinamidine synthase subunit PurL [Deltaproteobacteria bacterium]|nr:phosphoribosylformylglycinamidine synthase subunit PurL [Deltaproteobacteria bacterium]
MTNATREPEVTAAVAREMGVTEDEFRRICEFIGRTPNYTELGMFAVMWSEHCSYKSSRIHLKTFPTTGARVLKGPGENAGIVSIGDGLAVVFKMESHNHPSFIEPYQGAATGVGGIMRDIFTMGARPIANLNSLSFGAPDHPKTRYLLGGVVAGIGGYGNCMGVPTVGGELRFNPAYNGNILVNAMTVGLVPEEKIFLGQASGVGNPVMYVGSRTGRDGIHGATMASGEFDQQTEEKRPTVQVGDPFTEKLLLEACLEAMKGDHIVGIQDMGAAGLTCSTVEMADRGETGILLDLDRVPLREEGMVPYEMMLSESQERMLLVAQKGHEEALRQIFEKWDLQCAVVGEVTAGDRVVVTHQGQVVVDLPVNPLTSGAPLYDRPRAEPANLRELHDLDLASLDAGGSPADTLVKLLGSPNLCSRRWVWTQYDHHVQTNTVRGPGGDAAVVRIKGTRKALAVTSDVNPRLVALDPEEGAAQAVAEAARNVACVGAAPLAITDCLNFGNPEKPEIMWQFERAVAGIGRACRALGVPVISGNVSLYDETEAKGILPTPTVGLVGLIDDVAHVGRAGFQDEGDHVLLLGEATGSLAGSEWLHVLHGKLGGRIPKVDLEREKALGELLRQGFRDGTLKSAHDVSEGGLAVALAECCLLGSGSGASIKLDPIDRVDSLLFGEAPGRVIVTAAAGAKKLEKAAAKLGIPFRKLGKVGGDSLDWKGLFRLSVATLRDVHEGGLRAITGA